MSKYGNGVSMKSVMVMEMNEVNEALSRATIAPEDRKIVTDALKEAFYQWASSNASFCAFEEAVQARVPQEEYANIVKATIHSGRHIEKLTETYPDWEDEDEED